MNAKFTELEEFIRNYDAQIADLNESKDELVAEYDNLFENDKSELTEYLKSVGFDEVEPNVFSKTYNDIFEYRIEIDNATVSIKSLIVKSGSDFEDPCFYESDFNTWYDFVQQCKCIPDVSLIEFKDSQIWPSIEDHTEQWLYEYPGSKVVQTLSMNF